MADSCCASACVADGQSRPALAARSVGGADRQCGNVPCRNGGSAAATATRFGRRARLWVTKQLCGEPCGRWRGAFMSAGGVAEITFHAGLCRLGLRQRGLCIYERYVADPTMMGAVGALALAANVGVALLLYRYRTGDANMRSVWICSRNDAIGNVAVMLAALGVFGTGSAWPDLIVATIMAALALTGGLRCSDTRWLSESCSRRGRTSMKAGGSEVTV